MATTPSFAAAGTPVTSSSIGATVSWPAHTIGQMGLLTIVSDASGVPATVSPSGDAWIFDGVNDNIVVGDVLHKQRTDSFTLSAWITVNSYGGIIIGNESTSPVGRGYCFLTRQTGLTGLSFELNNDTSSSALKVYVSTGVFNLADGVEHHVAAVYTGGSNPASCTIYIDGVSRALTTFQNTLSATTVPAAGTQLYIGARDFGGNPFLGQPRHVSIWSAALSALQIAEIYNSGTPPDLTAVSVAASLELWFRLDGGDSTGVGGIIDRSSSGLDGTAQGGLNKTTSGWTAISNTNQTVGTGTSGCRMQLYRKVASSSSEVSAFIPLSTNAHVSAQIFTFSDVVQTASPVPISDSSVQASASTTVTYPAVSTPSDACLVVAVCANGSNTGSITGTMTNASLTGILKHATVNAGTVSYAVLSGAKASLGSVVAGTSLWTVSTSHVAATIVLAPVPDPIPATTSPQLDITPVRDGYSANIQNSCIEIEVAGGPIRKRQDVLYAPHIVTANWLIHKDEYSAFMGFFRTGLNGGEEAFLLDLITDIGVPTTHRCRTIGGIPRLTKQTGELYYASCTLEAEQNPTFTGLIEYREPNFIVFFMPVPGPYMEDSFAPGDVIQIIDSSGIHSGSGTHLNLDGTYVVESNVSQHAISLVLPTAVNSDWTVLAGLGSPGHYGDGGTDGSVLSTITRVPT